MLVNITGQSKCNAHCVTKEPLSNHVKPFQRACPVGRTNEWFSFLIGAVQMLKKPEKSRPEVFDQSAKGP